MWISKEEYESRYGEIEDATFNRLASEAQAMLDNFTTGVDGVHKLREFFPVDEFDADAVKSCLCKLINIAEQQENASKVVTRADGTVSSGVVKSVSSGSESVTYADIGKASQSGAESVMDAIQTIENTIRGRLGMVKDLNGVNLLYMGVYPRV